MLAGWLSSKVSKIEHGKQTPSEEDLQTWCQQCGTVGCDHWLRNG